LFDQGCYRTRFVQGTNERQKFLIKSISGGADWSRASQDAKSEMEDDPPIKGNRLLSDIYHRCNLAVCEPANHKEVINDPKSKMAMEEEVYIRRTKLGSLLTYLEIERYIKWMSSQHS